MDFSFIIVDHNSGPYLSKCLDSIKKNISGFSYEIIIVKNDGAGSKIIGGEKITSIELARNAGFGNACNVGAQKASGEILFFLNPDTEILNNNIGLLKEKIDEEKITIVAPRIIEDNGKDQAWAAGSKITPWKIILNNSGFKRHDKQTANENAYFIDWVSGAALAIKKEAFKKIGGFDENFFMYYEDIDLCLRIRDNEGKIAVVPKFEVLHMGGLSYSNKLEQKKHYYLSQNYYIEKHFSLKYALLIKLLRKIAGKI